MARWLILLCAIAAWAAPVKPGPTQLRVPVCVEHKQGGEEAPIAAKDFTVTLDGAPPAWWTSSVPATVL